MTKQFDCPFCGGGFMYRTMPEFRYKWHKHRQTKKHKAQLQPEPEEQTLEERRFFLNFWGQEI